MSRIPFMAFLAVLLVSCKPGISPTKSTATLLPATPLLLQTPATTTPFRPTETQIVPTETIALAYERTGVLLLVVSNQFDPVEFNGTREPLLRAGYEVVVAAYTLNPLPDNEGGPYLEADLLLSDVQVEYYDAIVFIGNESLVYLHDPEAHRIAQEAVEQGRVLAALCHGPLVLAEAGILEGKQATAWFGFGSDVCKRLQRDGAICTYARVQQDGLIITGSGPEATSSFVGAIKRLLQVP